MNIVQLEYFLAVCRTRSFTKAAAQCYTSRQNLSRTVRDLERELGAKFFAQSGNELALTVEGDEARRRAERIMEEVRGLERTFERGDGGDRPLNVLIGTNIINCGPYDISTALDAYGGVLRVSELGCKSCYEAVRAGEADIAFIGCMEREFPGCEAELLQQDRLYLLVKEGSELSGKDAVDINDLAGHRLSLLPDYEFQFAPFVGACKDRGLDMGSIDVISNAGFMMRMVRREDAVGIASAAFKENTPEGTRVMPLSDPSMLMGLYALMREGAASITAKDLASRVREAV